jgi:hypothetical protein
MAKQSVAIPFAREMFDFPEVRIWSTRWAQILAGEVMSPSVL